MFGNLFDEEGHGDGPRALQGDSIPPPPAPRGFTKLAGIWNQGSTCFLNSAVQTLSFLPEFRDAMFSLSADELGYFDKDTKKRRVIPIELQKLLASLMLEEQQAVSSKPVTDSFGWQDEVRQQHDVQELCSVMLPALNDSLKGTSGENLIRELLHIKTVHKIKCEGCGNTTEKEDEECTLLVPVEQIPKGLEQSLQHTYSQPEMMTGSNQYRCDVCETHRDAQKTTKLRSLPPVLMMALNRFATDRTTWRAYKVTDRFPFPMELDMGVYTERGQSDPSLIYELTAVIVHSGSCGGGHYTACIRDIDNLGHWEMMNDSAEVQPSELVKSNIADCSSPKQLVATILSILLKKSQKVTIDRLCCDIAKETIPWTKKYKRTHGSFPKFLKDNADIFHVEGNFVTLVEQSSSSLGGELQEDQESGKTENPVGADQVDSGASEGDGRKKPQGPQSVPQPGHNWFFFNDARVAPMLAEELQNEYGGKKSAYMLMYRRKNAQRPAEADGNPAYGVPQHLLEEIRNRNQGLTKEREEYEWKETERREEEARQKSHVEVELRYHFNYKMEDGMLTTDCGSVRESFPRNQTLGELMNIIAILGSGRLKEGKFRVHRMKCWEDKTHLYDELTDKDKTLEELSIENGTILFAWDGYQVDGQPVPTGVESEPLTLQLKQYCSPHTIAHTFPKNLTLREFRGQVSRLTDIPESMLKLQFPDVAFSGDHGNRGDLETLDSIFLKDKDCILFDGSSRMSFGVDMSSPNTLMESTPDHEPMTSDERFCVRIENRCDKELKESPVLELEIEKSMTVGTVKDLFMTMYSIQCDSAALQEAHPCRGLQAPYNEEMTVGCSGIAPNTHLVLDWTKMVLEFKLYPDPTPEQQSMQVAVNKSSTVQESLLAMAHVAGLRDPFEWHLCTSTFMFDRISVLEDWDMALDTSFHFFVLEKGRLPPKGHVSIPIWFYPSPNQLYHPQESTMNIDGLLISDAKQSCATERLYLGNIEISKDATLDVLRCQVAELLARDHCQVVTPSHLRLRMIEGKYQRLRKVLRDPNSTLRRLKVENKTAVGVQVVSHGASPCKEEILLNVQVRNQEMTYDPPQEMLWDTRCGTSAAKLRQDIACRLMVPEEMLVIAKHFPNEFLWKVLKDNVHTAPFRGFGGRRGKKRTHAAKPNVCHKPFCVEDGDTIGVIRQVNQLPAEVLGMPAVSVSADDFSTCEDILGRKLLEEERLQKQKERQGKGFLNGLSVPVARRPEVALKIQVQDYS